MEHRRENGDRQSDRRFLAVRNDLRRGPSDRIRTCGIVVPNHARYQLRYTRI